MTRENAEVEVDLLIYYGFLEITTGNHNMILESLVRGLEVYSSSDFSSRKDLYSTSVQGSGFGHGDSHTGNGFGDGYGTGTGDGRGSILILGRGLGRGDGSGAWFR